MSSPLSQKGEQVGARQCPAPAKADDYVLTLHQLGLQGTTQF